MSIGLVLTVSALTIVTLIMMFFAWRNIKEPRRPPLIAVYSHYLVEDVLTGKVLARYPTEDIKAELRRET